MTDTKLADALADARAEFGTSEHYSEPFASLLDVADNVIAALRATPAAEPVAWRCEYGGKVWYVDEDCYLPRELAKVTPLYAAINGPAACKALPVSADTDIGAGSGTAPCVFCADAGCSECDKRKLPTGRGAVPLEGPWTIERLDKWITYLASSFIGATSETTLPDGELLALLKTARAYQEAVDQVVLRDGTIATLEAQRNTLMERHKDKSDELARVKGERDRLQARIDATYFCPHCGDKRCCDAACLRGGSAAALAASK